MNFADSNSPDDDLEYRFGLSRHRKSKTPHTIHVTPETAKACQTWRPENPQTRKFYEQLIFKSKQPRPNNPLKKQSPKRKVE